MKEKAFLKYLLDNKVSQEQADIFVSRLDDFNKFLKTEKLDVDSIPNGKILEYTEHLVESKSDTVLDLLRAVINYANFTKKYDYIIEVTDISESFNAMDNLYTRLADQFNEQIRDAIFENVSILPLGADPDKKPDITKVVMKRLEEKLGEDKTIELLTPCLHGRPLEPIKKDREDFIKLNDIDEFIKLKKREFVEQAQKHQKEGTLLYAQYVDDEVVEYIKNSPTITPGIRKGDKIIATKTPYQIKKFLNAKDERMKRYYSCYCAWVRGAIKNCTEKEISPNFCYCSTGFTKKYWDIIFDQPIKIEPLETPLTGALECKFAINIPKEFQK
ncbi:MAG: hypothetical protein E3J52_01640 [Promethearchaeota archaeon]|nr:MAG: hypothetical protein E3J52_01640 [Candidatus Lokiarchaeota archaeon]